jgi:hypothetical protein
VRRGLGALSASERRPIRAVSSTTNAMRVGVSTRPDQRYVSDDRRDRGRAMHAVVVRVTVKDVESSRQQLNEVVVPRVKQSPGFQAGYWTAPPGGSGAGLSMVVFDSEQNAKQAAEMVRGGPVPDGVQIEDVEVREVVASA